ncbi:MAG: riboflavin synthase [Nitrospinae bacterium]|nr:riboflavin synthase [Nitrospinota bacterium]
MFTGIIQSMGTVARLTAGASSAVLEIKAPPAFWADVNLGDSIAVDGVCLTAKHIAGGACSFDVSRETLDRSIVGKYKTGSKTNLEKALRATDRLGGHIVQGHVDGVGRFAAKKKAGEYMEMDFEIQKPLLRYMVEKGSVSINGISLTVAKITRGKIRIALIPHTLKETNLSLLFPSSPVNIECDIMAKYAEKLLQPIKNG